MPPQSMQDELAKGEIKKSERKEILYEDYFYDVTDWIRKHPGGSVIEFYTQSGEDATLALQQFHNRSIKRVLSILKSFKRRPVTSEQQVVLSPETVKRHKSLTEDFQKLHQELEDEGYFELSISHVIYRFIEIITFLVVGIYFLSLGTWWATMISVSCSAMFSGRCGWLMHEGGHHSLTGYPQVDRFLQSLIYGVGDGMSSSWWSSQHNRHHAMPQRLQHDVDLQTLPLIAFNKAVVKNVQDGQGFFVQNQSILFFLVDTFLVSWFWKLYLHPRYALKKGAYSDLFFMSLHYYIFLQFGFFNYLIVVWLTSVYIFGNFSLSHTSLPVTKEPLHWVEYSLLHTMDIKPSVLCDWWMCYLNYQIEHHLFPTMPQFRHRMIRHRVKALADKHNIPYHCMSYWDALKKTVRNLAEVSYELKHME